MNAWGYVPTLTYKDILYRFIGLPHPLGRLRTKKVLRYLNPNSKTILDVGCGEGAYVRELSNRGLDITGLEISIESLKNAKDIFEKLGVNPSIMQGDAHYIPVKNEIFDQIICLDVIEHVFEIEKVIREINRVLKKDGYAIITVPTRLYLINSILPYNFKPHVREIGHVCEGYWYEEMAKILNKYGFEVTDHEYYYKTFSRLVMELVYLVMGQNKIKENRGRMYSYSFFAMLAFCIIYPIMHLDNMLPNSMKGGFLIVKVQKKCNV